MNSHQYMLYLLCFFILYTSSHIAYGQLKSKKDKIKTKTLKELFIKKANVKDFPKLRLRKDVTEYIKRYKQIEEYDKQIEELNAPLYWKQSQGMKIDSSEILDTQSKENEIQKKLEKLYIEQREFQSSNSGLEYIVPPNIFDPDKQFGLCHEYRVRICMEEVCVDQPMPLNVDDIYSASGSGCTFQVYDGTKFKAHDHVSGYSYRKNWMYHRGTRTSTGTINILTSGSLVEDAIVRTAGITFKYFPDPTGTYDKWTMNQSSACGWARIVYPNSWGRAKKFWDFKITSVTPNVGANVEFESAEDIEIENTGKCEWGGEHGCLYGGCWLHNYILGYDNPVGDKVTINIPIYKNFPKGTIFIIECSMSYEIKAVGEKASAGVVYGLEVLPYINLEACSFEIPEDIVIHPSDLY